MTRGNLAGFQILRVWWVVVACVPLTSPRGVAQVWPPHLGEGVQDQAAGPYNCAVMSGFRVYNYNRAALSTVFYAPDGVNWWPYASVPCIEAKQVWFDGYWDFFPLEIQLQGGQPYPYGQPEEAFGEPQLNPDVAGILMAFWPGAAMTWPTVGADFTDNNSLWEFQPLVYVPDPNNPNNPNPVSPLPVQEYLNGNPVNPGDALGTVDQQWSVVVAVNPAVVPSFLFPSAPTIPLTGPAAIHHLTAEYEAFVRLVNMGEGPVIYPH